MIVWKHNNNHSRTECVYVCEISPQSSKKRKKERKKSHCTPPYSIPLHPIPLRLTLPPSLPCIRPGKCPFWTHHYLHYCSYLLLCALFRSDMILSWTVPIIPSIFLALSWILLQDVMMIVYSQYTFSYNVTLEVFCLLQLHFFSILFIHLLCLLRACWPSSLPL